MASYGHTFTSGDTVTPTKLNNARTVTDIVNADIKSDAAIAGSKIDPSFNAPAVVAVNSASTALRVTQEGSGNALVVEDSANPDSTPLVVNNVGQIISGSTTPVAANAGLQLLSEISTAPNANIVLVRSSNDTSNAAISISKTRGTTASRTSVNSGDAFGAIDFTGHDGTAFIAGARISSVSDGTPGTNDMPGRLVFSTTADGASSPTERMRIDSSGRVGIGTSSPTATLSVSGDAVLSANTSTDALRITQEGSGNALVVEDSANPDSTPLVVNNVGQIISGSTTAWNSAAGIQISADSSSAPNANIALRRCSSDTSAAVISVSKSRGTGSSPTLVSDGDVLGIIGFNGHDGSTLRGAASISALVDGTPGASDMPGVLAFSTTADGASTSTERMRITSAGRVGIGTTTPATALDVNGTVTASAFAGPITGNVTGNLTGNVTGNVTGNLTGTASAIADGSVSTVKIVDGNVTTAKVADANITTAKIADSSVTNAKIASGVDASKLTTGTLPADRIGSDAITTARIAGGAVTTVKLADANVTTAKLADANVTTAKLSTATQQSLVPAGAVMPFARNSAPAGWLEANGNVVPNGTGTVQGVTADFSALYAAVGTSFGAAGTLPDLRGIFVRGSGSQTISGTTYSGTFAEKQADGIRDHNHAWRFNISSTPGGSFSILAADGNASSSYNIGMSTGTAASETCPANIALLYCIKF